MGAFITGATAVLPLVFQGVQFFESVFGAKRGADKEAAVVGAVSVAAPLIARDLNASIWLDPGVIVAVRDLVRAIVNFLNAVRTAQTQSKAA